MRSISDSSEVSLRLDFIISSLLSFSVKCHLSCFLKTEMCASQAFDMNAGSLEVIWAS